MRKFNAPNRNKPKNARGKTRSATVRDGAKGNPRHKKKSNLKKASHSHKSRGNTVSWNGRYPRSRMTHHKNIVAAIDLGTNSCRLLIANTTGNARYVKWAYNDKLQVVDAFSRSEKLGENVMQTGVLSEPAMERTLLSLQSMVRRLKTAQGIPH